MADTRLATLAEAILAAVVDQYATDGLDLPERRYTHAGQVAYDKDQLVVTLAAIYPGTPGAPSEVIALKGGPFAATARLEVHLVRCQPVPTSSNGSISATKLNEAGQQALLDARACIKAMTSHQVDFTPYCQLFSFTGGSIVGPEGGYLGVVTSLDVQL